MAIWTPTQKLKTTKLEEKGTLRRYKVEVPEDKLEEAAQNMLVRMQLTVRLPGFRQGKAPLEMVKRQLGDRVRAEAVEDLLKQVIGDVIKEQDLRPITMPEVKDLHLQNGKPLSFELQVEVAPNVDPKGYKGISVTKNEYAVDEKDIDERVKQLQEGNARLEAVEDGVIAENHYVVINFELTRDGKTIEGGSGKGELVDMSSEQTIDGLTQGLLGAKRGDEKEFEVKIEKKDTHAKVKIVEVKNKIIPALDDDFAKDLGFDTLDALKEKLREIVKGENERKSDHELQREIEEKLLSDNKFDVPARMVDQQADYMLQRITGRLNGQKISEKELADLKEKIRPDAEKSVRMQFIISEIAHRDKVEATDEEFQAELEQALEGTENDAQKKEVRETFAKRENDIRAALRERKVLKSIRDAAKIKTVKV
ncbi:MAG: trigger factor [Elusimicrobia bacterium CG1_02_63_36]|nr:MAG: trigger factor [Elusimicrobia bacterium CG1_02_63_36]PIP81752.1 MAG: trigger factor [Elusimicrobia bacterium CG22_combo_CG10-13_8_21_14_all_63_91]PJA18041.1 MAG: trigger factor [Elusimicrobia bacterium CG_4_10_14_0_2_um_filter_63_34]PJB23897.1 MAG: trigger factor [Elusimicrobia bacterium CG_4_9_14_3_um_filter_62_55]